MNYVFRIWNTIKFFFWLISAMYIMAAAFVFLPKVMILVEELLITANKQIAEDFLHGIVIWIGKIGLHTAPLWFLIFSLVITILILRNKVIKKGGIFNNPRSETDRD